MNNEEKINNEGAEAKDLTKETDTKPQSDISASPTPPAASNADTTQKLSKTQLLIAACAAIGVVLLLIIIIACAANSKDIYVSPKNEIGYIYNEDDKETVIFENGKMTSAKVEDGLGFTATSLDGTVYAMLTDGDALYVYTKSTLIKVADDVNYFKLSADGAALVYDTAEGEVMHYSIKKTQKEKITDTVPAAISQRERYAISPDGKTVAYVKGETVDDYALYIYSDSNSDKVGGKLLPLALSDGADLLYYYNTEKKNIYVRNEADEDVKLISDTASSYEDMYLNSDHTAVLFTANGNTYVCNNGEEKIKVSSDELDSIANMDDGWGISLHNYYLDYSLSLYTTSLNGFKELYFLAEDENDVTSLYYLDKKFESTIIEKHIEYFWTAPGSDAVYYLDDDGELFRATAYDDDRPKSIGEDINDSDLVAISSDATECYYVDEDDTLMYVKKDGKAKKIADDVNYGYIAMTHDDYLMFIVDYSESTDTGTFYYSHGGSEKKKIADEISAFIPTHYATYYAIIDNAEDTADIYVATKKANFGKLADDVIDMDFGF